MNKFKVSIKFLLKLSKTKKAFVLYNHENEKITNYIFTNDLTRYRLKYQTFKLVEIIKTQTTKLTIEI